MITLEFKKMSLAWVKALMPMSNQDMLVKLVICKVGCILSLREAFKKKKTKKVDICHLSGGGKIF